MFAFGEQREGLRTCQVDGSRGSSGTLGTHPIPSVYFRLWDNFEQILCRGETIYEHSFLKDKIDG